MFQIHIYFFKEEQSNYILRQDFTCLFFKYDFFKESTLGQRGLYPISMLDAGGYHNSAHAKLLQPVPTRENFSITRTSPYPCPSICMPMLVYVCAITIQHVRQVKLGIQFKMTTYFWRRVDFRSGRQALPNLDGGSGYFLLSRCFHFLLLSLNHD